MSLKGHFDLVIFDWAGTMVDFGCEAPVTALKAAFGAEGVVLDAHVARRDMGIAKIDHVRNLLREPEVACAWLAAKGRPSDERDVDVEAGGAGGHGAQHPSRQQKRLGLVGRPELNQQLSPHRQVGRCPDEQTALREVLQIKAAKPIGARYADHDLWNSHALRLALVGGGRGSKS